MTEPLETLKILEGQNYWKLIYNTNQYFGLGPIPKPKMANTMTSENTFQIEKCS